MAGKPAASTEIKGKDLLSAFVDLVIICLLVCGAAFGGYWYGIHERLAPVQNVPPGTPGALPASAVSTSATQPVGTTAKSAPTDTTNNNNPAPATADASKTASTSAPAHSTATTKKKPKYWITSSGTDYIGYSIVVNVNERPVDNFFGPGKTIDITRLVKHGDNTVTFEAKALGAKYNKHTGDPKAELKVQVVSSPQIQEEFKPSDVLLTYKRNASESENSNETMNFTDGD